MSTVVGVFAHPDDEAFGPGGTLAKLSQTNDVYLICCTDGDHQDKGLKNIRNKELLASCKILGVKDVFFLDFVDGSLSNSLYHQLAGAIKTRLDQLQPETVITFNLNGVSGHLDHIAVASVVTWLFPKLSYLKKIMYFTAQKRDQEDDYFVYFPPGIKRSEANEIVDCESVWESQVVPAMKCHESQKEDCDWILNFMKNLPKEDLFVVRQK